MKQPVGTTQAALSQQYARLQPTLAMQLIHDAQLWYIERYVHAANPAWHNLPRFSAAAPFHAALDANDAYTLIEQGAVTLGDIGDLYRYPNTLEVVKIKGVALKQWLEESAEALKRGQPDNRWSWINKEVPSYQFDTFKGLSYVIDPTQKIGQRVSTTDGIHDEQDYVVITNNYRASGGGNFANLDGSQIIYRAPDQLQHILIEYLKSLGEKGYSPELEVNWKLVAGAGFEPTTFGL
ncbi:5'-nucleotidase C-terminal domain-containing protein [Pseudidiomarina sp.]|uniref:5'-nucleotidase C-terminal domain-containing protein n=1 Tax=Pseudidiomarina sp. TaxID=2081707 RepID=UPI003A97825F